MGSRFALVKYLSHFSYFGVFMYFMSVGYVIPVPEEVMLLILGYLSGVGKFNAWLIFAAAALGVLVGDSILYWLAYRKSSYIDNFKTKIKEEVLLKYEQLMRNNIGKTMLVLRFFVGFRFLGPVIAGSLKTKWIRFFLYDLMIVSVYTGTFVYLGYVFRKRLFFIISLVEQFRSFLIAAVALFVVVYLIKRLLRKNGENKGTSVI